MALVDNMRTERKSLALAYMANQINVICDNCQLPKHPSKNKFAAIKKEWGYYICANCRRILRELQAKAEEKRREIPLFK